MKAVAAQLNEKNLPGLHFTNQPFIPVSGLYAGQRCSGVGIKVTDRGAVRSMRMGLEIAAVLLKKYPTNFDAAKMWIFSAMMKLSINCSRESRRNRLWLVGVRI